MEFEEKVTLFLDKFEFNGYKRRKDLILDVIDNDSDSEIVKIHLAGRNITIGDILELEDILDGRITVCSKYIGSAETIRSLGLD